MARRLTRTTSTMMIARLAAGTIVRIGATLGALGALGAGLSMLAAACGGSRFSAQDSGPSAETACSNNASAVCMLMQTCTPANVESTYGSEAICETRVTASCLDGLSAPSTGSNAGRVEACAQAYAAYGCDDYRNKTNLPAACLPAQGTLASGATCLYAAQCQSSFCALVPGSTCGACAAPPQAGDSCALLTSCGATLTCTTDTLVCVNPGAQGQACGPGAPCGAALSCVAPQGSGTAGTCQSAGTKVGADCDPTSKTAGGCDAVLSLFCDGLTKKCGQTTYAGADQPCGYDSDAGTLVECTTGTCVGATAGALGACAARAPDEGACAVPEGGASTPSAGCLPPARCIASSGDCQVVKAASCH